MATEILWWIFAAAIVGTALGVVLSRSVIHAAIFLIGSLSGVGAMYLFLTVEFVALVQFLIYGGAVTVLLLLALMLTRPGEERLTSAQAPFAAVAGIVLLAILIGVAIGTAWPGDIDDEPATVAMQTISRELFQTFGAPFIIASLVLLVALVGAIILARQEDGE